MMTDDEKRADQWAKLTEAIGKLSLSTIMAAMLGLFIFLDYRSEDKFNESLIDIQRQAAQHQERMATAMEKNAAAMEEMAKSDSREMKLLELMAQQLQRSSRELKRCP